MLFEGVSAPPFVVTKFSEKIGLSFLGAHLVFSPFSNATQFVRKERLHFLALPGEVDIAFRIDSIGPSRKEPLERLLISFMFAQ